MATHAGPGTLDVANGLAAWRTAGDVVRAFPDPRRPRPRAETVDDPNYPGLSIFTEDLSDHFMDTTLSIAEVASCRKSKTDHSWYRPDALPRCPRQAGRTVMATQSGVSRETFVIPANGPTKQSYRRPTVREAASFQAFPIMYQFLGASAEARLRQVGNAVPPPLAGAVARAIVTGSGRIPVPKPSVRRAEVALVADAPAPRRPRKHQKFREDRLFRDHLPGSRTSGLRVDFDNLGEARPIRPWPGGGRQTVEWVARLYIGSGKHFVVVRPSFEQALAGLSGAVSSPQDRRRLGAFLRTLATEVPRRTPDGTTLQAIWSGRVSGYRSGPSQVVAYLSAQVERYFPPSEYEGLFAPAGPLAGESSRARLPLRTLAFLVAATLAARVANEGADWAGQHPEGVVASVGGQVDEPEPAPFESACSGFGSWAPRPGAAGPPARRRSGGL